MNESPLDGLADDGEGEHGTGAPELGGYAESMAELDLILGRLQNDDIDIDTLTSQVERASLLISHCEQRLRATELKLATVLAQHNTDSPDAAA